MNMHWKSSPGKIICLGCFVLFLTATVSLLFPNDTVTFTRLWNVLLGNGDAAARVILLKVRIPRVLAGIICGCALAAAGELLQESLDNNLCSPGIMGINAGAGVAVLLASLLFPGMLLIRGIAAFIGAILSAAAVYLIAMKAGFSRSSVILSGVAVSSLMTALINVIVTLRPEVIMDKVSFSLGGLQFVDVRQLILSGIFTLIGCAAAFLMAPGIELFALGDEIAQSLGLPVKQYRAGCVLLSAFLAAAAVSLCGLLGFVGLIIPNLFRMTGIRQIKYRLLLSCIWGGAFLVFSDLLARVLFYPYELPAGVLLSCMGTPFFLYILIHRKRESAYA